VGAPSRAELIHSGGKTVLSDVIKPVNSVWYKDELTQQWKESIVIYNCKKGDKTGCN
jgi:hypothetical protein